MPPNTDHTQTTSFPELVYPSLRDVPIKSSDQWLKGKAMDDGAEGLWRIHDKLYDLTDFIKRHPGGENWLKWTKGTDITEAFESHHITTGPESMLKKFYVRDATSKRNSPFTFEENGFYRTLKRRVREEMKTIPKDLSQQSKRITDACGIGMFVCAVAACRVDSLMARVALCAMSAVFMTWSVICAHNFTHQRDNWRMYFITFNFSPNRFWRVTHVLSHHLYPNTLMDFEVSAFEPFFLWLPRESKSFINKYGPRLYAMVIYTVINDWQIISYFIKTLMHIEGATFHYEDLVPLTLPLAMISLGNATLLNTFFIWMCIWHMESFLFHLVGLNAAHHHPEIFHDGDKPKEDRDWGIHQLHAVMDRVDINGSLFKTLTNFGDHALHHLFPTFDHAVLPLLYPTVMKTCEEFQTEIRMTTQWDLVVGQFQQISRTKPKDNK